MKIIIIGAGFGSLGAACLLAKAGHDVTVIEKNNLTGGRAGYFEAEGFRFDIGPSWYLMPDIFEKFFEQLGEKVEDHLDVIKLQPGFRVTFKDSGQQIDIHSDLKRNKATFEALEAGAGQQLEKYLKQAAYIYKTANKKFLYKNYDSPKDFLSTGLAREIRKLSLFSSLEKYVAKHFKDPRLQQIMQHPAIFLGTNPAEAPALYSLLSHAEFSQGVFYPRGGIHELTKALERLARRHGAQFKLNTAVEKILTKNGRAIGVVAGGKTHKADVVISNADPYHTETQLLTKPDRDHTEKYWQSRRLAPSALLIYLGVNRQYDSLLHHNLLFSCDWQQNFAQIFGGSDFPDDPSLYVCAPSRTDPTVAPKNKENLFVLVPVAAGLDYTSAQLDKYADLILATLETELKLPDLRKNVEYKKLFCVKDFKSRYNSFKGTGLGLAHTLRQTAVFRPSNRSRKVKNLYYVGANVHPGIGLPVTLISGQLASERIIRAGEAGKQSAG